MRKILLCLSAIVLLVSGCALPITPTPAGTLAPSMVPTTVTATNVVPEAIPSNSPTEAASPDLKWTAVVLDGNRLILRDASGASTDLYTASAILRIAWFPDNQHILFINRDSSGAQPSDQVWVADISTREATLIMQSDTVLGATGITFSPDGLTVATSAGTGAGDACFMPLYLVFIQMGPTYKGARVFFQRHFKGLPALADSSVYPDAPGTWQNNTQFVSSIRVTCTTDESLAGDYIFDLSTLIATKK